MKTTKAMTTEDELREALTACMPFIDDAEDVYSLFPDSAASKECRAAVASARAALATSTPIKWPEKEKGLVLSMHSEGWNSAIDACRRAVEGKK